MHRGDFPTFDTISSYFFIKTHIPSELHALFSHYFDLCEEFFTTAQLLTMYNFENKEQLEQLVRHVFTVGLLRYKRCDFTPLLPFDRANFTHYGLSKRACNILTTLKTTTVELSTEHLPKLKYALNCGNLTRFELTLFIHANTTNRPTSLSAVCN